MPALATRQVAVASSAVLAISVLFPRLGLLQATLSSIGTLSAVCLAVVCLTLRALLARDEASAPVLGRPRPSLQSLAFSKVAGWTSAEIKPRDDTAPHSVPDIFSNASDGLRQLFDRFMLLIKLHFILPWYSRISPSDAFPDETDRLVRQVISRAVAAGEGVDWAAILVVRIVPLIRDHLKHYRTVDHLATTDSKSSSPIYLPLPPRPHPALAGHHHGSQTTTPMIEMHLRQLLGRLLEDLVPEGDRSEVVMTILREVLLGAVLVPVFEMLVDSDFWNRLIDDKSGQYLRQRNQVNRFLSVLSNIPDTPSATVTPIKKKSSYPPLASRLITAESSSQQFDAFIRSISRLKFLGEARRLRADIERETRLGKAVLSELEARGDTHKDGERAVKRAKRYCDRLDQARHQIDGRIAALSGGDMQATHTSPQSVDLSAKRIRDLTLYTVLLDPSSLAHWLEFMERRGRLKLVQFWLTLEGFKDPLEIAPYGTVTGMNTAVQSDEELLRSNPTMMEDVNLVYQTYFATSVHQLPVPDKHVAVMRSFIGANSGRSTADSIRAMKRAFAASQQAVYDQMADDDWPDFKRSELFVKAVHDLAHHVGPSTNELPSPRHVPAEVETSVFGAIPLRKRQASEPVLMPQRPKRPGPRPGPTLVNGSFTPASTVTPSASVSITPPTFSRQPSTNVKQPLGGPLEHLLSPSNAGPSTPGLDRRSSHLDILIKTEDNTAAEIKKPIFGDDGDAEQPTHDDDFIQIERMEAIQAALSEIIATDELSDSRILPPRRSPTPDSPGQSLSASVISLGTDTQQKGAAKAAPSRVEDLSASLPSLPSASAPQSRIPSGSKPENDRPRVLRRSSFSQATPSAERNRLFDDVVREEVDDVDGSIHQDPDLHNIQLAAPGNLHLAKEISRLDDRVRDLLKQEYDLDVLIRRAELTGNEAELRILRISISTVQRDLRGCMFQRAQYLQQEEDNRLVPGRTLLTIPTARVMHEAREGKAVARYTITIQQQADDNRNYEVVWSVDRRYSEFAELDKAIRDWVAASRDGDLQREVKSILLELPGKKLGMGTSSSLVEIRRQGLERYLKALLQSQRLCDSDLLRAFLSRSPGVSAPTQTVNISLAPHNIVKSIVKSVATSLDDTGPSMLDLIQTRFNRPISDSGGGWGDVVEFGGELFGYSSYLLPPALRPMSWTNTAPQALAPSAPIAPHPAMTSPLPIGAENGITTFHAPVCDLFMELFDLEEDRLRGQAVAFIIQQFLGSTIERKIRDTLRVVSSSDSLERIITNLTETLFPHGQRRPASVPRTDDEKAETRRRAARWLGLLIPDVAASMIGRGNARSAARKVSGVLQDRRLNQHLVLHILDALVSTQSSSFDALCAMCFDPEHLTWSNLSDAAQSSIIWIGISMVLIPLGWGFDLPSYFDKPLKGTEVYRVKYAGTREWVTMSRENYKARRKRGEIGDDDEVETAQDFKARRVPSLLKVFKLLTVLFHEMSHAIVGAVTGGKVVYISINSSEGGATGFTGSPWLKPTLAAGYLGSCLIGCSLLGAGFDALASKYAALSLCGYLALAFIACALVRAKSAIIYHRDTAGYYFNKFCGSGSAFERSREALQKKNNFGAEKDQQILEQQERLKELERGGSKKRIAKVNESLMALEEEKLEAVYEERMVSLELICLIAFVIIFCIMLPAWLYSDSRYLRYVIMFIGQMSAVYAVIDVYSDGIKHRSNVDDDEDLGQSDAHVYAKLQLEKQAPGEEAGPAERFQYKRRIMRRTKYLALASLLLQCMAIIATVLVALCLVRSTTTEQALEARKLLPSPFHYEAVDLLEQARAGGQSLQEGYDWGKGKLGGSEDIAG